MAGGITGETKHEYYCEAFEVYCTTFDFDSFDDFVSAGNQRFVKDETEGFFTRLIDLSNLILFRFDIKDYSSEGMYLQLHYGNPNEYKGLYHDVIKITKRDFKRIEVFLRDAYKKLEASFKEVGLTDKQPLYTDTSSFEKIVEGANKPFDFGRGETYSFDYNFPYHYQWYNYSNEKMSIVICFACQTHGYAQWIPRIIDLSIEQVGKIDEFLKTTVWEYIKKQWCEIADD